MAECCEGRSICTANVVHLPLGHVFSARRPCPITPGEQQQGAYVDTPSLVAKHPSCYIDPDQSDPPRITLATRFSTTRTVTTLAGLVQPLAGAMAGPALSEPRRTKDGSLGFARQAAADAAY